MKGQWPKFFSRRAQHQSAEPATSTADDAAFYSGGSEGATPAKFRFGTVEEFHWPFSAQLKDEIRRHFPEDRPIYRQADEAQSKIVFSAFLLRAATLLVTYIPLLVVFSIALSYVAFGDVVVRVPWLFGPESKGAAITVWVLVATALPLAVRYVIREIAIRAVIRPNIQDLTHVVSDACREVRHEVTKSCNAARSRPAKGSWPEIAQRQAIRAMHGVKRAEYLDRYSTTVFWKIEFGFRGIEFMFAALKIALFALLVGSVLYGYSLIDAQLHAPPSGSRLLLTILVSALFAGIAVAGWFLWRNKNNFLTVEFIRAIPLASEEAFAEIGNLVRDCVTDIEARDRPNIPPSYQ